MKRLVLTLLAIVFAFSTPVFAQQAGDNVNVLPVVPPVDGDGIDIPDWYLKGDGYLQRQVEPTIAASTLNPDHLLAFFNDYRAVDQVVGDVGLGEGELVNVALKMARLLMPPPANGAFPGVELALPINASEAWIGGSRSYDGGYTWSGFYLPGAPESFYVDGTPPGFSQDAPIFGLEAATDPVLAPGPCGTFYVVFVAFTRGGESKIAVARYRDSNDFEGRDTIAYEGMEVIESGNNAEFGYFLDKPDIEVDVMRPADPADECAHRIYVTYSTFNGLTKEGKVQTKMNFAKSEDGGLSFSTQKINKNFKQNQGSTIAVDPRPGSDGGTIYVFWRHFFDPDAIAWTKSPNFGSSWSNPRFLTGDPPMAPFDQPTISVATAEAAFPPPFENPLNPGFPETAFRSNGFPTAAVAPWYDEASETWEASVHVAWQERVNGAGLPDPNGLSGIVMMSSANEGGSWSGSGPGGSRQVVDKVVRTEPFDPFLIMPATAPAPDHPDYQHLRPAGPQVQPKLSFGGGQLMLTFYESRGRIAGYGTGNESIESDLATVELTPFISGYDRVMDFRATLLEPDTGLRKSSAQVSRYPLHIGADLSDGQDLLDVAPVNAPCFPDSPTAEEICVRQVNHVNDPTSALGTSPFIGDYPDTVPYLQFVPDSGGGWRWAISETDVPSRGFHAIWTDNRHLNPPTEVLIDGIPAPIAGSDFDVWDAFQFYGPPGIGGSCINPGSRNTDVLTSRVDTDVIISAPTTFKQLDDNRSFPFSISNKTSEFRRFTIRIVEGAPPATLSPIADNQDTYNVTVFPFSSSALTVFVPLPEGVEDQTDSVGTIRLLVELVETTTDPNVGTSSGSAGWTPCSDDCVVGSLALNAFDNNPPVQNINGQEEKFGPSIGDAFVINWEIDNFGDPNAFVINNTLDNAFVINQSPESAFVINNTVDNAFVINAFVINAFVINSGLEGDGEVYGVTDVVWTMDPGTSNTAGSYLPLINIDNAEQFLTNGEYAFQLIVDRPSSYGLADACADYASSVYQQQVLSNVVQNPADPNAFVINRNPQNAFVINNQVDNAFVINSAFALAPAEGSSKSARMSAKAGAIDDSEARAEPPSDEVRITLRAFQLVENPTTPYNPDPSADGWLPSVAVAEISCDPRVDDCFTLDGPDLQPIAELVPDASLDLEVGQELCLDPDTLGRFGVYNDDTFENKGATVAVTRGIEQLHGFFLTGGPDPNNPVDLRIGQFATSKTLELGLENAEYSSGSDCIKIPSGAGIQSGDYTLVYKVDYPLEVSEYDETNNSIEYQIEVTDQNVPPTVTIGSVATPVLEGVPVQFTATVTDEDSEIESVVWDFGDGTTDSSGNLEPIHTFVNNGFYFVTLTATDDRGAIGSAEVEVTVLNSAPSVVDLAISVIAGSSADVVLTASDDGAEDALTFDIVNGPTVGSVNPIEGSFVGQPPTATVVYTAPPGTCGMDSFGYVACDEIECSNEATVAVTISPLFTWFFDGLFDPYTPPVYTANAGSTVPLNWQYVDANGVAVKSGPQRQFTIRIDGWPDTECGEHSGSNPLTTIEDAGSSGLRYSAKQWKFNWQTKDEVGDPLEPGCYEVTIVSNSECTIETGGPFAFQLE